MPLTIALKFPTGRYVAAAWGNRDEVEWPPHPARLCLALVDVLHKRGNSIAERQALEWLFRQVAPTIVIPADLHVNRTPLDGVFVPQNPSVAKSVRHPRKERSFPTAYVDPEQPTLFFHWPLAEATGGLHDSLETLASALPRFGHSSSLVIATVSNSPPPEGKSWRVLVPLDENGAGTPDFRCRVNWDGLLKAAETAFDVSGRADEMADLVSSYRTPNPSRPLNPAASGRGRHDPRHCWQGYAEESPRSWPGTPWDQRIFVLKQTGGTRLGLASAWQLTTVFHQALLDRWSQNPANGPVPSWLSGHRRGDGHGPTAPLDAPHLAVFPLPFVDAEHAPGYLLGLGLGMPRPECIRLEPTTLRHEWRQAFSALFGTTGALALTPADRSWSVRLVPEDSPDPPLALRPWRWTRPSTCWHSVTPIILERHPKPRFEKDPLAWRASCRRIVSEACIRVGLPEPQHVEVSPYSPVIGVLPAPAFVAPEARPGRPARFHIHASVRFDEPVAGPVLLGAGRYRGYGLCVPVDQTLCRQP